MTSFQDLKFRENRFLRHYFLINNVLLYHSLANFLAHNKKMTEIFSPPAFGLAVLYHTVIDHEFVHNIVKVTVDPGGDSRVDPQTTLTTL